MRDIGQVEIMLEFKVNSNYYILRSDGIMKKCIVKYQKINEEYNCYCNFKGCEGCSNKNKRVADDKCTVPTGNYCTCRLCIARILNKEKH